MSNKAMTNKIKNDALETKDIIETELVNKIKNVELLIDNNKHLTQLNNKTNKLIVNNKQKINYFNRKTTNIENSKNIANRNDDYNKQDYDYYNNINRYITYILWLVFIIYIYYYVVKTKNYNKKTALLLVSITIFMSILHKLTNYISTKYFTFMRNKSKYYRDLEYKIDESKDL
jgi:hypothetical protein